MKFKLLTSACALAAIVWVGACKLSDETGAIGVQPNLPDQLYDYSLNMPGSFGLFTPNTGGGVVIDPIGNFGFGFNNENPQITNAGATLGRVLFYDPQLSINNRISCSSCHKQELAFSDDKAASVGFAGKTTPRNSMAILNAGFNRNLFWDSRSSSVKDLSTRPIQNHIEMGMEEMQTLVNKLAKVDFYPALFQAAFGSEDISEDRVANALSQFVCAITTANSKFDREEKNQFAGFSSLEKMGMNLFFSERTNCNRCHAAPNFAAPDFPGGEYGSSGGSFGSSSGQDLKGGAGNGLDLVSADKGLGEGKFRIPSLRNIALTAPYMHDGRFKSLSEVIDHYDLGIKNSNALDKNLRNADGTPKRMNFNALEKEALIAFLHTLTDESLLSDPRYSNPFRK